MKNILPNKMWELLKLAQKDLRACEKNEAYTIEMHTWVTKSPDECVVCLAGSVMVQRFKNEIEELFKIGRTDIVPASLSTISDHDRTALRCIDSLRVGDIRDAWIMFYKKDSSSFYHLDFEQLGLPIAVIIGPYGQNKKQFHREITKLIKLLKEKDV